MLLEMIRLLVQINPLAALLIVTFCNTPGTRQTKMLNFFLTQSHLNYELIGFSVH